MSKNAELVKSRIFLKSFYGLAKVFLQHEPKKNRKNRIFSQKRKIGID